MFVLIHVSCVRNINSCKNLQKPSSNEVLHLQRPAKLRFINLNRTMAGSIPDIYFTIDITGSPTKVETLKTTVRNIYGLKMTVRNIYGLKTTVRNIYGLMTTVRNIYGLKTTVRSIYGLKATVRNVRCMIRTGTRIYRC